jgi:small subunit ribosomal protein S27e
MTGEFLKVKCEKCKNQQVIFEKPATEVKCLVCNEVLAIPKGGSADFKVKSIGTAK